MISRVRLAGLEVTRPISLINKESTKPIIMIMEGTRPPTGASPTQPCKCGQYFKVKVKIETTLVLANAEINKLTLILIFKY